jgi:hypothetical protein
MLVGGQAMIRDALRVYPSFAWACSFSLYNTVTQVGPLFYASRSDLARQVLHLAVLFVSQGVASFTPSVKVEE